MKTKNAVKKALKILSLIPGFLATVIGVYTFIIQKELEKFISEIPPCLKWISVCFVSICFVLDVYFSLKKPYKQHKLNYGSSKFIKFFKEWYSQNGKIFVVCDDISWTFSNGNKEIYDALYKKATEHELILYLGLDKNINEEEKEKIKKLNDAGAMVYARPNSISNYAFSFLEVMGNMTNKAIVRNKANDPSGKVIFEEREDEFLQLLLETLYEQGNNNYIKSER